MPLGLGRNGQILSNAVLLQYHDCSVLYCISLF